MWTAYASLFFVFLGLHDISQIFQKLQKSILSKLLFDATFRTFVKRAYQKTNFLISQPKHMLWILKRTVSMR